MSYTPITIGAPDWGPPINNALTDQDSRITANTSSIASSSAAIGQLSVNVKSAPYGAQGDGTTDDTAAIQAALNATPAGGVCFLPAGRYATSTALNVPPYVTLAGTHGGNEAQSKTSPTPSAIVPLAGFTGDAVIRLRDQQSGGYATLSSEITIRDLTIDGTALPAGVDGIQMIGQIQGVILEDVQVREVTRNGINTLINASAPPGPQYPFCLHFSRVSVLWSGGTGVALNNATDSNFYDVYCLGNSAWGWYIAGTGGSTWVGCRAEWSGNDGFYLATNSGTETFIGCSTDRNSFSGFNVDTSASTGAIILDGCRATRDGAASVSAGHAGLRVTTTTRTVLASNFYVKVGADDGGGGLTTPQYGVSATGSANVTVSSGQLNAVTAGWNDGGGNTIFQRGTTVTGTGITTSLPSISQLQAPTADVPWASHKITGLANGTAAQDAAAFGQIPVAGTTAGTYAAGNDSRITGALQTTGGTLTGALAETTGAAATVVQTVRVTGDTQNRVQVRGDGRLDWGPGNAATDTNLYRDSAGVLKTDSFLSLGGSGQASAGFTVFSGAAKALQIGSAGGGLSVKEGTNGRLGVATLVAGTVTIPASNVTATTRIFLSRVSGTAANFGNLTYTISAGTSFTINSTNAADTSVVNYMLVEPF